MDDSREILEEMDGILATLSAGGFRANPSQTAEAAAAEREQRAALERRYQQLAVSLPPTGSRAATLQIMNHQLSGGFLPKPDLTVETDDVIQDDPMLRHLAESGQSWE
jgi:hypothetical protein